MTKTTNEVVEKGQILMNDIFKKYNNILKEEPFKTTPPTILKMGTLQYYELWSYLFLVMRKDSTHILKLDELCNCKIEISTEEKFEFL